MRIVSRLFLHCISSVNHRGRARGARNHGERPIFNDEHPGQIVARRMRRAPRSNMSCMRSWFVMQRPEVHVGAPTRFRRAIIGVDEIRSVPVATGTPEVVGPGMERAPRGRSTGSN
jgi:hypothetical protein